MSQSFKPLSSIKVLEFEGIGPAPLCGQMLAQQGAQVTVIKRPYSEGKPPAIAKALPTTVPPELGLDAGKNIITINLKNASDQAQALALVAQSDVLIEGLRPGVMERFGLSPLNCHSVNPRLVYGRITGWGQTGPWAQAAGHDLNYVALSGLLSLVQRGGEFADVPPTLPPTVVGDAAGALGLAFSISSAVLHAKLTGQGSVIDSAMVDTAGMLGGIVRTFMHGGGVASQTPQPQAPLAGSPFHGSPFYDAYRCADGRWLTLCPLEPQFYALLLQKLGYNDVDPAQQFNRALWPALKTRMISTIASQPLAHWDALFAGTDVCYAPVLSLAEAAVHPQNLRHR